MAFLTALGVVACGRSASVLVKTPSASTGSAQLTINITLTGVVAETGQLVQPVAATCAAFAQGRDYTFLIPSGPAHATLAGNVFKLVAPIAQYVGPGGYTQSTVGFTGNQLTTRITVGPAGAPVTFASQQSSEEAATVFADGSGSFTFLEWGDLTQVLPINGNDNENGVITWTCTSLPR